MTSRNTSVTVTKMAYSNARGRSRRTGETIAEILAAAIDKYPLSTKSIEIIKSLRSRQIALSRSVAERLDEKIGKVVEVDGEVTRSEVLDFILQQCLDHCGKKE